MAETLEKDVYAFIDEMADDDWNAGQEMDPDDYNEFARMLEESGYESSMALFNYYFEVIQQLNDNYYYDQLRREEGYDDEEEI